MNFCITVRSAPNDSSHLLALRTCNELLAQGHTIEQVFFYESAVLAASQLNLPDQDEFQITKQWQTLARDNGVKLYACVAAALKRGIVDSTEAKLNRLPCSNLADYFEITGLGQWVGTLIEDKKMLTFK